jgi:hypothetical protein
VAPWRDELALLAPAVVVLLLVSSQTGFSRHLRYVLPALPYVFVWMGAAAGRTGDGRRARATAAYALAGLAAVASLWRVPHSLSYFNVLAGGPRGGHAHLVDSNIDWGQDLVHLRRWIDRHPEARPLHLAYYGTLDPRHLGIEYTLPPRMPRRQEGGGVAADGTAPDGPASPPGTPSAAAGPLPGWHAVSVNLLRGYPWSVPDGTGRDVAVTRNDYSYFLLVEPEWTAGYSIYIYHFDLAEANRLRAQLGLPPLATP